MIPNMETCVNIPLVYVNTILMWQFEALGMSSVSSKEVVVAENKRLSFLQP